jgi:predicted metalloprotease with PDZ domain
VTVSIAYMVVLIAIVSPTDVSAQAVEPIVFTVTIAKPESHSVDIEAIYPAGERPSIELMMPVWSPGFYRVQDYAGKIEDLSAKGRDGTELKVEHPSKNRWRIETGGAPNVTVAYRLKCNQISVTTNYVGDDLGVFNGAATFPTMVETSRRPHEVRLMLPAKWKRSMTALRPAPDGLPDHYRAEDFEMLVDSPIVAGNPSVHEFEVNGSKHLLVDIGELGAWDGERAARELEKIVEENNRLWGSLPFRRYLFLNVFRQGRGGLEHKDSTLLTANPSRTAIAPGDFRWLSFVSHEYFHAFNVKRLRPVELGPFDYERPPRTRSLWISEGVTSYYGELLVTRAGLAKPESFLAAMSSLIEQLQNSPGRLVQTLEQSSLDVWTSGTSGVGRDNTKTVSYYVKGPIAGFLLDARIRRATGSQKSLDDLMRLTLKRYGGDRGFTADQFRMAAEEVAGTDLKDWFGKVLSSTDELDYAQALDWYGLRFATVAEPAKDDKPAKKWTLEIRADSSAAQKVHFQKLFAHSDSRSALGHGTN